MFFCIFERQLIRITISSWTCFFLCYAWQDDHVDTKPNKCVPYNGCLLLEIVCQQSPQKMVLQVLASLTNKIM